MTRRTPRQDASRGEGSVSGAMVVSLEEPSLPRRRSGRQACGECGEELVHQWDIRGLAMEATGWWCLNCGVAREEGDR